MELKDLISELKTILDDAELAADAGNRIEAREHLKFAKDRLDDEFLND